jgi:hypothetical protein
MKYCRLNSVVLAFVITASYWLGVKKNSALSAKSQFKKGEVLDLYLIRLGATISNDDFDWALLVEDVRKAR